MPDERQTSTREGIAPAPESGIGREAERRQHDALTHAPVESRPDSAMGGTSDADSPADESWGGAAAASGTDGTGDVEPRIQQREKANGGEQRDG